jgi:hypothetical protein
MARCFGAGEADACHRKRGTNSNQFDSSRNDSELQGFGALIRGCPCRPLRALRMCEIACYLTARWIDISPPSTDSWLQAENPDERAMSQTPSAPG